MKDIKLDQNNVTNMVVFVIAVIGAQQNAKEVGISIPHLYLSVFEITLSRSTRYHKELLSEQITNNLVVMVG